MASTHPDGWVTELAENIATSTMLSWIWADLSHILKYGLSLTGAFLLYLPVKTKVTFNKPSMISYDSWSILVLIESKPLVVPFISLAIIDFTFGDLKQ